MGLLIAHHAPRQMQKQLMVILGFAFLIALSWVVTMRKIQIVLLVIMPASHAKIAKITIALNVLTG